VNPEIVKGKRFLLEAHPNPFKPTTTLSFELSEPARTTISVYSITGQLVQVEDLGIQPVGRHNWTWKADDRKGRSISSGVYFVMLKAGTASDRAKVVLLK